jgi:hypothetical protein
VIDPWGHYWSRAGWFDSVIGIGAWAPIMWKTGQQPPF